MITIARATEGLLTGLGPDLTARATDGYILTAVLPVRRPRSGGESPLLRKRVREEDEILILLESIMEVIQ